MITIKAASDEPQELRLKNFTKSVGLEVVWKIWK
jgi:hypothetical protein